MSKQVVVDGAWDVAVRECPTCHGVGLSPVSNARCASCGGEGLLPVQRRGDDASAGEE